jgi:hypothetical protein
VIRLMVAWLLLLVVVGCSPEGERTRAAGRGADIGNSVPPIGLHGDRRQNNPDYHVPKPGRAPQDARGTPGWWTTGAAANAR